MWEKIKWYVYGGLFILGVVAVWFLTRGDNNAEARKKLNKWINDKRTEIVQREIEKKKAKSSVKDEEIKEIEKKLEDIEQERQANGEEDYDENSMQELADLYKNLNR